MRSLDEVLDRIPSAWRRINLGDLALRINPGFPSGKHNKSRVGIPHIRPMNISPKGEIDLGELKFVEAVGYDPLTRGDVLFNNTNSPVWLGKTAVIKKDSDWAYSNHMTRIRPNGKVVESIWLSTYLHYLCTSGFFKANCTHHVNQASINSTFLSERIQVPIPPLNEQKRIVAKIEELFTKLDAGVEALQTAKALLKRYRQSVLQAAVTGKLTEQWREEHKGEIEPASVLLERIKKERRRKWEEAELAKMKAKGKTPKDEKWKEKYEEAEKVKPDRVFTLYPIPKEWSWTNIDFLSEVVRGASPRPAGHPKYFGGDIPWITVGSLTADESPYLTSTAEFVTADGKRASRFIEPDTLLLTNSGATLGVPKITRIGGCINDGSVALQHLENPIKLYLYYFLRTLTKRLRNINQGAAQPNLNTGIVRRIPVPLPPLSEQIQIIDEIEKALSIISVQEDNIEHSLEVTRSLRQSILKQAFEGKLVPQDPKVEPAEKLLERIGAHRENVNKKEPNELKKRGLKPRKKSPKQGTLFEK